MAWPPNRADRRRAFQEDGGWVRNTCTCTNCDRQWSTEWSCACDEDCPVCGSTTSPDETQEVEFND